MPREEISPVRIALFVLVLLALWALPVLIAQASPSDGDLFDGDAAGDAPDTGEDTGTDPFI